MRELTRIEEVELEERKQNLDAFLAERMPVLVEFCEMIGVKEPHVVLMAAEKVLPEISRFLEMEEIGEEDQNWLISRVGYLIGEYFAQKFAGCWYLNSSPDTRFFLRYVVGKFDDRVKPSGEIDSFGIARDFVHTAAPRDLIALVKSLEDELLGR